MNKFRRQEPPRVRPLDNRTESIRDLSLGAFLDRSPRMIPPGGTPEQGHVRFEGGALRKEFGSTAVGTAVNSKILGIGEHKYILNNQSYHRLVRLYLEGSVLALDVWDGSAWTRVDTFASGVYDTYLDLASTQSRFLIADGSKILTWYEAATTLAVEDDFPAGNSLTDAGETVSLALSSQANDNNYSVRYYVDLIITNGSGYEVTVGVWYDNGSGYQKYSSQSYIVASGSNTWLNELLTLITALDPGDGVQLRVESITATTYPSKTAAFSPVATINDYEATKSEAAEAYDDQYDFKVNISGAAGSLTVDFRVDRGSGWELLGSQFYDNSVPATKSKVFTITGVGSGAKFGVSARNVTGDFSLDGGQVDWESIQAGVDFTLDVHGNNKATDADTYAGVEYTENVPPSSTLEPLNANAPAARFILPFGDRLLAYRDGGDVQAAAWSADGDITDWVGGDSGETVLLDTRSDGIDAIMGAAVLSSTLVAVFRQRSIMRAQETGNVNLAVGHFHWIEELGTESPFSIQSTPWGILFLGHDMQVYLLTESGPQPVGMAIHKWLIENVTSNLHKVDSAFDGTFFEYYLGVPEGNSSQITKVWILDVAELVENQKAQWRSRPLTVERLATVSEIE